jgi:hypothetical protein
MDRAGVRRCRTRRRLAGLVLARVSQRGASAHVGFAVLSLAWMATTVMGVTRIRRGDLEGHRRWMTRSLALTFAAVTLRINIPLGRCSAFPRCSPIR